jgi:hypothetical protein
VTHRRERPIEFHTWDAVLTLWLMGWLGVPAELLLWQVYGLAACAGLMLVPTGYVKLRRRLHASGRLRCDWLDALPR